MVIGVIRKSTEDDKNSIANLLLECFGHSYKPGAFIDLNGKYFLYEINGVVVAMTGLLSLSEYYGLEVDWTGTSKAYRQKGLMSELFRVMLKDITLPVYCNAWRIRDNKEPNLSKILQQEGFVLEKECEKNYFYIDTENYKKGCNTETCPYWSISGCFCQEDLYKRAL